MSRQWIPGTVGVLAFVVSVGQAEVTIDWVSVGDAGNEGELTGSGEYEVMCGGVDYVYRIGKYEITNGQYREFLNAVAAVGDANGLYNASMMGITRTGSGSTEDPWVYTPRDDDPAWDARPVSFVSWYDALRFANWIHNGQPAGSQDDTTTEDGSYDMTLGPDVVRKPGATVFLPTEDEWYKAAFYKGGGTNAGYWDYATQSDTVPTREAPPGTDHVNGSALYDNLLGDVIPPPYYITPVGAYSAKPSDGAYGTYDQNGNMREWLENIVYLTYRGRRGGCWTDFAEFLHAAVRDARDPNDENVDTGFRLEALKGAPIPILSEWGLIVVGLLVLTAGTLVLARKRGRIAGEGS